MSQWVSSPEVSSEMQGSPGAGGESCRSEEANRGRNTETLVSRNPERETVSDTTLNKCHCTKVTFGFQARERRLDT